MGIVRFENDHFAAITGYGDCMVYKTSIARTPQQNGVVKRRNRTPVEAARTMLIFSKSPEFMWAETIATLLYLLSLLRIALLILCDGDHKEVFDNTVAKDDLKYDQTSSSSSIVVDQDDAPQIVSSLEELVVIDPNSPVFNEVADEFVQEDVADFDGNMFHNVPQTPEFDVAESSSTYQDPSNMHQFHQQHRLIDDWTKNPIHLNKFINLPRVSFVCQSQYTMDILKKHRMEKCDIVSTPMATTKLDADLQGTPVDQTKYHSMIGGLMYLTASRPDIAFMTFVCARYQARPTKKCLKEMQTMQGVMMIAKAHPEAFNFPNFFFWRNLVSGTLRKSKIVHQCPQLKLSMYP
ncbi:gag-pol polyprotein [Tanacetum coccineum]